MDFYQKMNTTIPMVQRMNKYLEFEPMKEEQVLVTDVFDSINEYSFESKRTYDFAGVTLDDE